MGDADESVFLHRLTLAERSICARRNRKVFVHIETDKRIPR
jgi:hypothetical protein